MSIREKNRRHGKRSVRVWFGCPECGMYGDVTTTDDVAADALLALITEKHTCHTAAAS